MTDDDYHSYDLQTKDYDKGIRALKQMWGLFVSKYPAKPEYAEDKFAEVTTKFLDRLGFHNWSCKSANGSAITMSEQTPIPINCALNYGEKYVFENNTVICYSPYGIRRYCNRTCQAKNRIWLVRPLAYCLGEIVAENINVKEDKKVVPDIKQY